MKKILYIFVNRKGETDTFTIDDCVQADDMDMLSMYAPEKLTGDNQHIFDGLVITGFFLSNWHVIETK